MANNSYLLFGLAVCLTISLISAQDACPSLFKVINNRCYLFGQDFNQTYNWQGAKNYCNLYTVGTYIYDLLILDNDIAEPDAISDYMTSKGYLKALVGARDLNLTQSQWAWADGTTLSLQNSLWQCDYPNSASFDHVGEYTSVTENIDNSQVVPRFRLRNVSPSTVAFFICEGPLMPEKLTHFTV